MVAESVPITLAIMKSLGKQAVAGLLGLALTLFACTGGNATPIPTGTQPAGMAVSPAPGQRAGEIISAGGNTPIGAPASATKGVTPSPTILATAQGKGTPTMTVGRISSPLINQGVLYVRSEYHQVQKGFSRIRREETPDPLTTVYEWWLDSQNPWRFRRATSEILDGQLHLVGADGCNGVDAWWNVDWAVGIVVPERHAGLYPLLQGNKTQWTFDDWLKTFWGRGQRLMESVSDGKAKVVEETEQPHWGKVLLIETVDAQMGYVTTSTVRAEAPHIVTEWVVVDANSKLFAIARITNWEWLEPASLPPDFWLNPPEGIPFGLGNQKP